MKGVMRRRRASTWRLRTADAPRVGICLAAARRQALLLRLLVSMLPLRPAVEPSAAPDRPGRARSARRPSPRRPGRRRARRGLADARRGGARLGGGNARVAAHGRERPGTGADRRRGRGHVGRRAAAPGGPGACRHARAAARRRRPRPRGLGASPYRRPAAAASTSVEPGRRRRRRRRPPAGRIQPLRAKRTVLPLRRDRTRDLRLRRRRRVRWATRASNEEPVRAVRRP